MGFLAELWSFMRVRKKFWLAPMLIVIGVVGVLLLSEGSARLRHLLLVLARPAFGSQATQQR
jgi:hypothetical protein